MVHDGDQNKAGGDSVKGVHTLPSLRPTVRPTYGTPSLRLLNANADSDYTGQRVAGGGRKHRLRQ